MKKGRSRSRTGIHAAIAATTIAAGLGAVGAAAASNTAADHTIEGLAGDDVWHPANRTIQTGDKVTWTFAPGSVHNVKSSSPNWTLATPIPSTDPAPYTFTAEGAYTFLCEVHPGTMTGTITVQDEPVEQTPEPSPSPSPSPSPTPSPIPQPSQPTTPAPTGGTDTVKPKVARVRLTASRRAVRVRFRLSEPATVTIKIKRRGSRRVLKSASVQARAGTRSVTLRSKRLAKGRYTVEIQARDAFGNRSSLARKQLALRR